MRRIVRRLAGALATTAVAAASVPAGADSMLDGSKPLICAATTTAVCEREGECARGSAESVNLPVLWRVDVASKSVKSLSRGTQRASTVLSAQVHDEAIVVQGAENGLGWSLSVDRSTGAMVLAGGRKQGFVAFGTCTAS